MPKNRKHGKGSVSFDNTRQQWQVAYFGSDGKRHYKRFDDEDIANAYLIDQLHDINHGSFVAPSDITIGQWAFRWIDNKKGSVRQRTYEYYTFIVHYISLISGIKLQELEPFRVNELYRQLSNNGLSAATIYKVHSFLRSLYKDALNLDMVHKNIMQNVPTPKVEKKTVEIFNKNEINTILATAQTDTFKPRYPIILLAITTGMRMGEILGLRWCDIDLAKNEIFIQHTLTKSRINGLSLTEPKTKNGIRKISIPLEVANVLKEMKSQVINMDIKQETFLFMTHNGTLIDMRTLEKSWERILLAANVPYRKFHALRHTHATTLLAEGIPIVEVSHRLGHAKIAYTLDLYGQLIKGYDKKISDKISKIYDL
ncbi:tyrosine-type recombinase/integrase [Pectinatus frisingensis]|uniref:tyrosine-type recombinase/integrase n=1 Tax=Pectinatus frisingensis TaxID=865 RepID=UPI0018C5B769|nr:site-specific integrase [Pectinatus frisingensis]